MNNSSVVRIIFIVRKDNKWQFQEDNIYSIRVNSGITSDYYSYE